MAGEGSLTGAGWQVVKAVHSPSDTNTAEDGKYHV